MVRSIFFWKRCRKGQKIKIFIFFSDVKLVFVRRTHHFDTFFSFWFVDTFSFSTSALFSSRLSRLCDSFLSPPHRRHQDLIDVVNSKHFPARLSIFLFNIFVFFWIFPWRLSLWLAFITFFCLSPRMPWRVLKTLERLLGFFWSGGNVRVALLLVLFCYSAPDFFLH